MSVNEAAGLHAPTGMAGVSAMPGPDAVSVADNLPKAVTGPMAIGPTRPAPIVNSSVTGRGIGNMSAVAWVHALRAAREAAA